MVKLFLLGAKGAQVENGNLSLRVIALAYHCSCLSMIPHEVPAQLYWGTRLLPRQNNLGRCNPEVIPTIRQSLGSTFGPSGAHLAYIEKLTRLIPIALETWKFRTFVECRSPKDTVTNKNA